MKPPIIAPMVLFIKSLTLNTPLCQISWENSIKYLKFYEQK